MEKNAVRKPPSLAAVAALHEALHIAAAAVDCFSSWTTKSETKHFFQMRSNRQTGAKALRRSVSPLVQAGLDRAARIGLALRVLAMAILVESSCGIIFLGSIADEA